MPNVVDSSASIGATSSTAGSPSGTPLLMNAEIAGSARANAWNLRGGRDRTRLVKRGTRQTGNTPVVGHVEQRPRIMPMPEEPPGISRRASDKNKPPNHYEIYRDADGQILGHTVRLGEHGFQVRRNGTSEWFTVHADAPHTSAMWWLDRDPRFTIEGGFLVGSLKGEEPYISSPDELPDTRGDSYHEGSGEQVKVNKYERSSKARKECLKQKGYRCAVCELSLEERYGSLGHEYINVHHLVELSTVGPDYKVNPKTDLIPICPNCHSMIHRPGPGKALTPEELKQQLRPAESRQNARGRGHLWLKSDASGGDLGAP
jgi:5-methylcytosine-specific restriction endonuclease McrA